MTKNMTSHELAKAMQETAEYLLSRPEFDTLNTTHSLYLGSVWSDDEKPAFLAAAKALGNIKKQYTGTELEIETTTTPIRLWARINRDKVCRKVQEEKWECEALLTPADEEALTPQPIMSDNDIPF